MRRVFLLLTLTLVLLVGCSQGPRPQPTATTGATYTVAPGGNDSAGCGGVMRTIQRGLRCPGPGDTLLIRGGQYPEQLHALFGTTWPSGTSWDASVTIKGAPGETVVINPQANAETFDVVYIEHAQYLIFDNLTLDAGNTTFTHNGMVFRPGEGAHHIRLQNSVLKNGGNGVLGNGPGIEIIGNEISGMGGYGVYLTGPDNLVDGNFIHDNAAYGIHLFNGGDGWGTVSHNVIRNNRIVHNGWGHAPVGSCGMVLAPGDHNVAINNVIEDHKGCGIQVYGQSMNSEVARNTITGMTGPCIDVNPGARGTVIRDNACQRNGGEMLDNGGGTQMSHNWFEDGPIPDGYGARGVVTGPSATGRSYSTAP